MRVNPLLSLKAEKGGMFQGLAHIYIYISGKLIKRIFFHFKIMLSVLNKLISLPGIYFGGYYKPEATKKHRNGPRRVRFHVRSAPGSRCVAHGCSRELRALSNRSLIACSLTSRSLGSVSSSGCQVYVSSAPNSRRYVVGIYLYFKENKKNPG